MWNSRLIPFWIVAAGTSLILIVLLRGLIALIPLVILVAVICGLLPLLLGALAGFLVKKCNVLAGGLTAIAFLLIWLAASPPLQISYGDYVLNRLNFWHDYENLLSFIVCIVIYGAYGSIGGELGGKLRSKLTSRCKPQLPI